MSGVGTKLTSAEVLADVRFRGLKRTFDLNVTRCRCFMAGTISLSREALSSGPDIELLVRRAAGYVDRMLRGDKPANLPVEQPARLLLSINMNAAKSIDIEVPEALLLRADRIIE